jgi:hypothetical protein
VKLSLVVVRSGKFDARIYPGLVIRAGFGTLAMGLLTEICQESGVETILTEASNRHRSVV